MSAQAYPPVKVGLLGLGTVGGGVTRVLARNAEEISRRAGREIVITHAAARNLDTTTAHTAGMKLTGEGLEVVDDPEVSIIVELMGGYEPARTFVLRALANGKHVVTANKALIARHGNEIFAAASAAGMMVGRPDLRHRGYRRRPQADDPRLYRVRHSVAVRQGLHRRHRPYHP